MLRRVLGLALGIAACLALVLLETPLGPRGGPAAWAAATAALMIAWWASEAVPLWITALAPLVLLPLGGVFAGTAPERVGAALAPYVDPYVLLFLGGMAIAAGLQETGLHRRIAVGVLARVGASPTRVVAGVMLASASVSLWISNTASAALVLPIALALLAEIEEHEGPRPRYAAAVVLAVAWGANIGGMGTKIGTPTNAQLAGFLARHGTEIPFLTFSLVGVGFVLVLLPIAVWVLTRSARKDAPPVEVLQRVLDRNTGARTPWSPGERAVLGVFLATAVVWVLAQPIRAELARVEALSTIRTAHVEAGAALLAGVVLAFLEPGGKRVLTRRAFATMPLGALLLIGGSFGLASGIEKAGLSDAATPWFARLAEQPAFLQTLGASLATVGVSAFASNTATIGILLPVLSAAIPDAHETVVLFAATFASSCDFALPAGTPPNAIVFGSGRVPFATMVRTGVLLDLVAGTLAAAWCTLVVPLVVG